MDGGSAGEDEAVAGAVDQPGTVEVGDGVEYVLSAADVADQLLGGPGSLVVVDEQHGHDPRLRAAVVDGRLVDRLLVRHGELRLLVSGPRHGASTRVGAAFSGARSPYGRALRAVNLCSGRTAARATERWLSEQPVAVHRRACGDDVVPPAVYESGVGERDQRVDRDDCVADLLDHALKRPQWLALACE